MQRITHTCAVSLLTIKEQLLCWAHQHREYVLLDSNEGSQKYSSFDLVLAVDAFTSLKTDTDNAFADLEAYRANTKDYIFGYLSYDLKNDIEQLSSNHADYLGFADLFFFQPKKLFFLKGETLTLSYLPLCEEDLQTDLAAILQTMQSKGKQASKPIVAITQRTSREDYLRKVSAMKNYIQAGEIYEANFCMEFYAEKTTIDPVDVYRRLNDLSTAPFASLFRVKDHYIICASPERFLRKTGACVVSQPIKGTAARATAADADDMAKRELAGNAKERAENIMIVDLVRNDLSKHADKGSVAVEELCEVYTFKQVHHLVSTITATVSEDIPIKVIKAAFPMGSMTGAPKIAAMKIIDELEDSRRGVYSGAIGYFSPAGDFDFNVVIRSILYHASSGYLSFTAGSAITAQSEPAAEYEECLIKARAMMQVLGAEVLR